MLKGLSKLLGRKSKLANADELGVARLLLAGDDPRLGNLLAQVERGPISRSSPNSSGFRLAVDSASSALMFDFELPRLESPWVPMPTVSGSPELEFRVVVVRPGFLHGLEGRTADGTPWPLEWHLTAGYEVPPEQRLQLPPAEAVRARRDLARSVLSSWLGIPVRASIATFPGVSEAQLSARELELHGHLPQALRSFYGMSDGLESRDLRIFELSYIYPVDNPFLPALLLTWDQDDRDEFVVVVSLAGDDERVYRLDIHEEVPKPQALAEDFRAYLSSRIDAQATPNPRVKAQ
jgi:hypothetical protein